MPFMRREGQVAWRAFVDGDPTREVYAGRFPTGYGKTEIIIDAYDSLRASRGRTRLLIVVPTDTQLKQYTEDLERKARYMGIALRGVVIAEGTAGTLKYHRQNMAEVFVATVQRIGASIRGGSRAGNWLFDLLTTGSWIGAADEYHHYANDNGSSKQTSLSLGWGDSLRQLTHIPQWIAVSATPNRKSGETIFGDPVIDVSYADGLQEGNILKDVSIHVREFSVDTEDIQGHQQTYTTSELREEIGTEDIDTWEARRQLRYLTQFASPIIVHAIQELEHMALISSPSVRPQMLVYVHSCAMAQAICELVQALAPGFEVDWVGTGGNGRPDTENATILASFKDQHNDAGIITRSHTLDVLVQVNKASEGFDSKPVCVILDLSLSGFGPQKLQQYGRGTRYYYGLPLVIYVPTDSAIAPLAYLMSGIFDLPIDTKIPGPTSESSPEPRWSPLPRTYVLDAHLIGGHDYDPSREEILGVASLIAKGVSLQRGEKVTLDPEHNEEDYELVRAALAGFHRKTAQVASTTSALAQWKENVTKAVGKVALLLIKECHPGAFDKKHFKPYCERINGRWKRNHGTTTDTVEEYRAKYEWLCDIEAAFCSGEIPAWARV
jgi:superfamily II DNA or RNA helicase